MRLAIATVASAVGLKGHVRLIVHTDDPAGRLYPGAELLTDAASLTVADVRQQGRSWQVSFCGHDNRTAAEALRDTRLYIDSDDDPAEEDAYFYHEIIGLPVRTVMGEERGTVRDVLALPAQDVLVIDYEGREVLLPFVTELVPEISDAVIIDPPGGLFEEA
ncbi:MAG: ribosome maturation factor RimM [Bowdeniella nasicola]|nr:ribosome maturation factor RimM [Bowdeniella nasicola]